LGAVSDYFSDMVGSRQSISECYAQNFESCDSNNALNWERRHCRQSADTCPRSLATWRSLNTFNSTVSVLWYRLYADWWIGIMLWALKKRCSCLCITLSSNLDKNGCFFASTQMFPFIKTNDYATQWTTVPGGAGVVEDWVSKVNHWLLLQIVSVASGK